MVIFLYGADSYRSKEKLDEIISQYKSVRTSGLNLIFLDAGEIEFADVLGALGVSSMFAETKLIVLKNVFANKVFQESFSEDLKKLQELKDVIVVYEGEAPDQRLKLFKTLLKEAKCQEFDVLDTKNLKLWAAKKMETLGAKINNDAL